MKKPAVIILIAIAFLGHIKAQNAAVYENFLKFDAFYKQGDLLNAKNCILGILESKDSISNAYLISAYIDLGIVNTQFGKYQESIENYQLAETLLNTEPKNSRYYAYFCMNIARTYNLLEQYSYSVEFLEKGIRILQEVKKPDNNIFLSLSVAYQNLSVSFQGLKDFEKALFYLKKSADIKTRYHLKGLALIDLNIANIYVKTNDPEKAQKYFVKSIQEFKKEYGENYFRLTDVYFDYSLLLEAGGRGGEALSLQKEALAIGLKNFGEKHPDVARAYKLMGDHYLSADIIDTSLVFYQKATIALLPAFNDSEVNHNPSLQMAVPDVILVEIIKKKSEALERLSLIQKTPELKVQFLKASQESIGFALQLIEMLRNNYMTEESRLFLTAHEKESYVNAVNINHKLFSLTHDKSYLQNMYNIAVQAKAAILFRDIAENQLFYSLNLPDSLRNNYSKTQSEIAVLNGLIRDEERLPEPDGKKIDQWKDALFGAKRLKEEMDENINSSYPQYQAILQKTRPVSLEEIQKKLRSGETLIEYFLSNEILNGNRLLYIFTVSHTNLSYHESLLDSAFAAKLEIIKKNTRNSPDDADYSRNYPEYTDALHSMYMQLINPIESDLAGNKLIIIPDEEIAYLPFDAFIKNQAAADQYGFEGLDFLIRTYSISYGYSSSLVFLKRDNEGSNEVYSFSPDYDNTAPDSDQKYIYLKGTREEIKSIYRYFKGMEFMGRQATESNFREALRHPAIFHLAMHSITDTLNSKYSFLAFDAQNDSLEDGKLYDYEISQSRIKSPMLVLSACNTGIGKLYQGEGVMSITRAFLLAGASSVVKTLWDVNDDAGAKIIAGFYKNLHAGQEKDEALRQAKLEFLKNSPPTYANPYYWAAYQVMGDKSPVKSGRLYYWIIGMVVILAAAAPGVLFYFRRRRILPD